MPRVSVIIPTYNRKDYVQEAIDSVLAQTYTDYEIIVVDDGSTDGTGEALQARYGDRIRYVWQENQGESVARNRGIEMARGEYVAFLDSDDMWLPEKLEKQIAFLSENPEIKLVFSSAVMIDAGGRIIGDDSRKATATPPKPLTLEELCFRTHVLSTSTVLMAAALLRSIGGFDPSLRYAEDYDLWMRLRLHTEVYMMQAPLAYQRRHRDTQCYYPSAEQNALRLQTYLSALNKFFVGWPDDLPHLRSRAIARQYAEVALLEAAAGNMHRCREHLEAVARHDPKLLGSYDDFGKAIVDRVAFHFDQVEDDLSASIVLMDSVLEMLRSLGHSSRTFLRKVRGRCWESLGFVAHHKSQAQIMRNCFLQAISLDPSIIANIGVLSLLFESVTGYRLSDMRKPLWRKLGKT